jgi:hypothetical protein
VAGGAAALVEHYRVDRADFGRLGRHGVEQRDHRLLERMGDVDPGEARGAGRGQQVLETAALQGRDVHQVVMARDACRREGVLVQRRRQGFLDVGADQADEHA